MDHRFEALHIIYDGTNGQLPNLDLINSMVNIAGGQMGVHTAIQGIESHSNNYQDRLHTILRGMMRQSLGLATGPHSSFIPYHVDAITLQPYGEGWHDEMTLGRVIEGTFRSLNNLLEHLHQSFFFYLLMHRDHFVSIGTYLPSAMLLAANFSIMAIFLWVKSGQAPETKVQTLNKSKTSGTKETTRVASATVERDLFLPISVVTACQALSVIPLFTFNNISTSVCSLCSASQRMERYDANYSIADLVAYVRNIHLGISDLAMANIAPIVALQSDSPAISADQVVLSPVSRHVPCYFGNAQFLSSISGRNACNAFHLCANLEQPRS